MARQTNIFLTASTRTETNIQLMKLNLYCFQLFVFSHHNGGLLSSR